MLQHFFRISESHLYRTVPAYNGDSNYLEFFRLQCQHDSQAVIDTRITVKDEKHFEELLAQYRGKTITFFGLRGGNNGSPLGGRDNRGNPRGWTITPTRHAGVYDLRRRGTSEPQLRPFEPGHMPDGNDRTIGNVVA